MGYTGQMDHALKLPCMAEDSKLDFCGSIMSCVCKYIVLDTSHIICLLIVYSCFPAIMLEFCSCDRDPVAGEILKYLLPCPLRKSLHTPALRNHMTLERKKQKYFAREKSPKNFLCSSGSMFFIILEGITWSLSEYKRQ